MNPRQHWEHLRALQRDRREHDGRNHVMRAKAMKALEQEARRIGLAAWSCGLCGWRGHTGTLDAHLGECAVLAATVADVERFLRDERRT